MTKRGKIITSAISLGVVLILAVLFFITSRHSDLTFQATAPPREVTPVPLPPPILSTIAVKADLPIQDVQQFTESALRDYLSEPIEWKKGAVEAAIKLNLGTSTMTSSADGTVSASIPFQFNGWVRVSQKILGRVLEKRKDVNGAATVSLTFTPIINPDWSMTAKVASDISVQKAEIEILWIPISVPQLSTELIRKTVLPKLEDLIVQYIASIDVRTRVADLWTKLYEPMVLNQDPPITLVIEPLEVLAQQPSSDGKTFSLSLGITTYVQASIGNVAADLPDSTRPRANLPNLRFVDSLASGYHIITPIEVTYTALENLAKPHVEKTHKLKGIETLVENLTFYGSGTQLAAGFGFSMPSLGAKGQFYLLGTPVYDATTMSLSVTEFDYSLTTQSLLLKVAEKIGKGTFPNLRPTIAERLVFPLETQITTLHEKLSDVIAERAINPYIRLHGTVDTITPEALYLTPEGIRLPVHLQGNLACEITLNIPSTP